MRPGKAAFRQQCEIKGSVPFIVPFIRLYSRDGPTDHLRLSAFAMICWSSVAAESGVKLTNRFALGDIRFMTLLLFSFLG
ncbi:MAG: hypothetical protein A3E57_00345 [Candidatus Muproteobacteria bacterium RIFCSPHIGHO2_12_FULL_60_33]|uniref:Uncharacterized protein n=1 Tax=Candidatus Muproteobacteria bacterium RIFCSPLOWO2_01_FULL_60_18 TaxID=1817768 RepID=A0A1F6U0P2_9PROT|nr:MAG: hypothetical protein A3A87_05715 [Candidatus Muproteobacteria bacterium RIFCSPLOWO2_01_FULL_60_18]OGI51568.1 MAG: hypothetical protein A2W42_03750 [Candidatus Muproteobacteria bacterium RIFCSPHIGHO2_01_60_12]OGI55891.1 MAG: hypothetical protein A3E57_00345 [Candidatus Muproteobacteria bacterium RIFCSPHIGHO2_12_FULL_60_33]